MVTKTEHTYIIQWVKKIKAINLLGGKCCKCNEDNIFKLCFHHENSNEKEFEIHDIKNYRWSIIEKEIQKCILLCRNCHAEIHSLNNESLKKENKKIYLEFKNHDKCEKCNYNKCLDALEFHHKNPNEKEFEFRLKNPNKNLSVKNIEIYVINELNKCEILCANCHAEKTTDIKKFEKYKNLIYNWDYKEIQKPINKDIVIRLYREGKKQLEIAKELNCAKSTICGIIKKLTILT
jgi:hypothetical protein